MFPHKRCLVTWLGIAMFVPATAAWAEVIVLKDGKRIEGKIIRENEELIEVQVSKYGITMTQKIGRPLIKSISKEGTEAEAKPAEPQAAEPQPSEKAGEKKTEEKAEPASPRKPASSQADEEERDLQAVARARQIRIDLRMALAEPLIRDSFEDGSNKMEPRSKGAFFVLVPFHYTAGEAPLTLATYNCNFGANQGSARVRGFLPLDEKKAGSASPTGRSVGRAEGKDAKGQPDPEDEPVEVELVRGSPVYEKMTIYEDADKLMVHFHDAPKPKAETPQPTTPPPGGRTTRGPRQRGPRPQYTPPPSQTKSDSRSEFDRRPRGYERAYQREKDTDKEDREAKSQQKEAALASKDTAQRGGRDRSAAREGKPGSGWAAMLVEVSNEAAVITARLSREHKVAIELRLLDALGRTRRETRTDKAEDELRSIEAVAEYVAHDSPELSRLAVRQLARLRSPARSGPSAGGAGKVQAAEEPDKRTRLIEVALLNAMGSKDERTQRLAWQALTSTDTLPDATEQMIASLSREEVVGTLLKFAQTEIKEAGHLSSGAAPAQPARTSLLKTSQTPLAGLGDSAVPQAVWAVLGALMRVGDAAVARGAVETALADGSKQAIAVLGQPYPKVARLVLELLAKAPKGPVKRLVVPAILSGVQGTKDKQGAEEVLTALAGMARQMTGANDPLRVTDPADPLMEAVASLRDSPDLQLKGLSVLRECELDAALDSAGVEKWLSAMTDSLVAKNVQEETYKLVADKWCPNRLPPLNAPRTAEGPAGQAAGAPTSPDQPGARLFGGRSAAAPQGTLEKFLVTGLASSSNEVQNKCLAALVRAGLTDLALAPFENAKAPELASLIKSLQQMTSAAPASLLPGAPSRFVPLSLLMAIAERQKDPTVYRQAAATLGDLSAANAGPEAWRLALAFKRVLNRDVMVDLCSASDQKVAEETRKAVGGILGLAEGEMSALAATKDRTVIAGKFDDYDKQRGGKPAGRYNGLILLDVLIPSYNLVFDETKDPEATERGAKITNLSWVRKIIAVEPGVFDVVVGEDRNIEVKLGPVVVGTGKAPSAKEEKPATRTAGRPAPGPPGKAGNPQLAELMRRAQQQRAGRATPEAPPAESQACPLEIQLVKLMGAMAALPGTRGKLPMTELPQPAGPPRSAGLARPREGGEPTDPFSVPMAHMAFGTRQGSLQMGEGRPPQFEKLEVRVNQENKIVRGAQPVPVLQEVQIFLEPVREGPTK
jgi:hypothetical protein